MKKRLICLFASLALILSLSACGANDKDAPTQDVSDAAAEETVGANPENIMLEIAREGEGEMVPASLYQADGYFFYVTEDFEKISSEPDTWQAVENPDVTFSISRSESSCEDEGEALLNEGYECINGELDSTADLKYVKTEDGICHVVRIPFTEDGVAWLLSASYPEEAEEGFGAVIATMFDIVMFN